QGQYDKLVSIEMIEAVGSKNLGTFFRVCSERLKAHGRMALQAITTPDQGYESHVRNTDFIQRYIFPGGELVSTGAVQRAIGTHTDMRTTHLEDLTRHYAQTLKHWRTRFHENREAIKGLGLDERFLLMWEYYLSYCEGGFAENQIGLLQMIFEKPLSRRENAA
ncbi:class I SAM-dependent methyltransferase, partial [Myxococcota bacterium]|nr:class I SAM-dependent methyltransferase [Myxococcota bacterium]